MLRVLINIAASIIEVLLVFRLLFKFLMVNPRTPFVAWLYGITERLVAPFTNILPNWRIAGFMIDFTTLAALVVYAVAASLLLMIIPPSRRGTGGV